MTNYKLEFKKKYTGLIKWPINLVEYLVFKDEVNLNKCLILKLKNQSFYKIQKIDLEIKQFNDEGDFINKACYLYDNLNIDLYKEFIPSQKIKLEENCARIEYTLLHAESIGIIWEDGWSWIDLEEEVQERKETPQNITKTYHKDLSFPYFITFTILMVFILAVIGVFFVINA